MKSKFVPLLAIPALAVLAGCYSPKQYETDPVAVQTSRGIVTCQLYTVEKVLWDRSINRPENMTVAEADQYCVRAGYEVKEGRGGAVAY